jgi:hypothetical protein
MDLSEIGQKVSGSGQRRPRRKPGDGSRAAPRKASGCPKDAPRPSDRPGAGVRRPPPRQRGLHPTVGRRTGPNFPAPTMTGVTLPATSVLPCRRGARRRRPGVRLDPGRGWALPPGRPFPRPPPFFLFDANAPLFASLSGGRGWQRARGLGIGRANRAGGHPPIFMPCRGAGAGPLFFP